MDESKAQNKAVIAILLLFSQLIWFAFLLSTAEFIFIPVMFLIFVVSFIFSIASVVKKSTVVGWVVLVLHLIFIVAFLYLVYQIGLGLGAAFSPGG